VQLTGFKAPVGGITDIGHARHLLAFDEHILST
jgi:hypothetical protein